MAYDLEQQEQLDAIKAWWATYGMRMVALVVIVVVAVSGWLGWQSWQRKQSEDAAVVYDQLGKALGAKDTAKAQQAADTLASSYGRTVYASMAALQIARVKIDAGDLAAAKAEYDIAIDRSRAPEIVALARYRKAAVLLDEKNYDEALKVLNGDTPDGFTALYADRRGDVYRAQDKLDDARREYRAAIDKLQSRDAGMRNLIQVKLDALGEG
jgi:predicted negative regulator of RcsB-dependent stress response